MRATDNCSDLEGKDTAAHVEYLRGDRSKVAALCVVAAIKYLSVKPRAPEASAVLIRYLDYADPRLGQGVKSGIILYRYPAVDILTSLGKSGVPELVATIANADTTELVRRNATLSINLMYGLTADAIGVLVSAAHAEADPMAANRIMNQARWLAATCIPQYRNDCENAVLK